MALDTRYFGEYAIFQPADRSKSYVLMGSDNIVGDRYDIVFERKDDEMLAWLVNRFGATVGVFDANVSRRLNIMRARGWTMRAVLSYVGFDAGEDTNIYWGEAAIIANDPLYDAEVEVFVRGIGEKLAKSTRPDIDLSTNGIDQMLAAGGNWLPSKNLGRPNLGERSAVAKDSMSFSEQMVEKARANHPGCYVGGVVMVVAIVAVLFLLFKACSWI